MLFIVVERFKDGNGVAVSSTRGRMLPDGLAYRASWVAATGEDEGLLDAWMAGWRDLVDFEVVPVVSSEAMVALHRAS